MEDYNPFGHHRKKLRAANVKEAVLLYLPNAYPYKEEEMLLSLPATNISTKKCQE